ncbi:hypothetical protein FOCC_FOCC008016 [Frankliniella occidentalis]|uniref:Uncharacterized protein LOC113202678 n=1 Tax=Frankliniella occidentalis TaxID=133901 RepID=A0A9C6U7F1_FRAOC|nr:uncharacterized protein LOC113202678 [Frankliniella occidentalis]KAE8745226.1 hypothetical protein FOCC_FOCC008016 [Frankliniella occidentalis]
MSKKNQDLSKLRKKLEQSSKKTRRSTDLRRSLGRKSVGDSSFSDIATLEQASFSGSTFNESCHLNPDSAIIDPAVTENPDWFKTLPPDLQASESSILEALQKDRDTQLPNNSNISLVNASFDKRKVHEVLDCSVVVSRESIDRQIKRPSLNVDDSASGSPLIENLSKELPQRRPNTLGKGLRKRSKNSLDAQFRNALEESEHSDESLEVPRKISKTFSKEASNQNTVAPRSKKSSPNENSLGELPQRRPTTLGKGLRKRSKNSLDAEFRKALEESGHSDESLEVSRKTRAKEGSNENNITTHSKNVDLEPSPVQDSLGQLPQRRPNSLGKGRRTRSKSSLDAEFREALEDSGQSEENLEALRKLSKSSSNEISQKHKLSSLGQTQNQGPLLTDNIPEDLPRRRPNTLGKGLRNKSKNSLDAEFRKALEESGHSDESLEVSRNARAKEGSDHNNITTHSKNSCIQDSPEEVPQRRSSFLGKGQRTRSKSSLDVELREALEDSAHSEENLEALRKLPKSSSNEISQKHNLSTLSKTPNLGSPTTENLSGQYLRRRSHTQLLKLTSRTLATANIDKSVDESLDLPRRKQTTIGKYLKRDFADNSALDEFKKVLEDTSSSEDERDNVGNTATPNESLSRNPVHDKENVPHIKITPVLEHSGSDSFNLPLGAEASNLSGLPRDIEPKRKSLFLGRKRVSKESAVSVVAEDTEPEPSQESRKTDSRGNLEPKSTKLGRMDNVPQSSEDSVTDNTRHLPLSTANIEVIQSDDLPVNLSAKSRNSSQFPVQTARSFSMLNISSPQVQSRKSQQVSVLSEIVPVNLSVSRESGMLSPRSAAVLSEHPSQAMNDTPLSTQESQAPRRISKSFQGKLIDKNLESPNLKSGDSVRNTGVDDESCHSSASTISLPSNLTSVGTDSVFTRGSSNAVKISCPETLTSSVPTIDTPGSDSVFTYPAKNKLLKSSSLQTESIPSSNSIPPTNVPEVRQDGNDSWTENPYPDRTMDSFGIGELEPLGKDSSPISESDDESDEGYANEGESSDRSENPRMAIKLSHLSDASAKSLSNSPVHSFPSPAANLKVSDGRKSIRSSLNQSNIGLENVVAAVKPNFEKTQNIGKKIKAPLKAPPKKLTEPELDKMRSGLKKWMDDIKKDVHTTVEESRLVSTLKTTSFKKPEKPAPKAAKGPAKKKDPDPYFGDYRPPKRVKPRPYVTDKMYKFLEKKLKDKFGLEARIKAEDFVAVLCNLVQNTIKEKNKNKYHKMVFKLRSEMVKLGLIRTQFDYHLFIEDYLPDAFRVKSIPCYGCSKGPTLDVEDLYSDLSVK